MKPFIILQTFAWSAAAWPGYAARLRPAGIVFVLCLCRTGRCWAAMLRKKIRMWVCGAHGKDNRETGMIEELELENFYPESRA